MEQEALSWCRTNLDPNRMLFENSVDLMTAIQMTKTEMVTWLNLEMEELHSVRVNRNSRQTATVPSFQTTFSKQFIISGALDVRVNFPLLKTSGTWNRGNEQTGLRFVLARKFAE